MFLGMHNVCLMLQLSLFIYSCVVALCVVLYTKYHSWPVQ